MGCLEEEEGAGEAVGIIKEAKSEKIKKIEDPGMEK